MGYTHTLNPALSLNTFICLHFPTSTIEHVQRNHTHKSAHKEKSFIQYINTRLTVHTATSPSLCCVQHHRSKNLCHCPNFVFPCYAFLSKSHAQILPTLQMLKIEKPFLHEVRFLLIVFHCYAFLSHLWFCVTGPERHSLSVTHDCKTNLLAKEPHVPSSKYQVLQCLSKSEAARFISSFTSYA